MPESDSGRQRTALLVLGMHRSGTSLLSGLIAGAGVDLGRHLMAAAPDNPRGFWENQALVDLNESLLSTLGQTWASWEALPENWLQLEEVAGFRNRLAVSLDKEFAESPVFCVKDPRLCRLLPLWLEVLREKAIHPVCLFISRPVAEVAASLQARDGIGPGHARALWLRHGLDALRACERESVDTVNTSYADLLQNPGEFFGRLVTKTSALSLEFDKGFADNSLRHHALETRPEDAWSIPLYDCLRGDRAALPEDYEAAIVPLVEQAAQLEATLTLARTGDLEPDSMTLQSDRERRLFAETQDAKRYASSLEGELLARDDDISRKEEFIASMREELRARDDDASRKEQFIASLQEELGARDADIMEKERFLTSLQDALEAEQRHGKSLEADARQAALEYAESAARSKEYNESLQFHLQAKEAELVEMNANQEKLYLQLEETGRLLEERTEMLRKLMHRFRHIRWLYNTLRGRKHSKEL